MRVDALSRYYNIGWLAFNETRWRAHDRLRAGTIFYEDYYLAGFDIRTVNPEKIRVDCQGFKEPDGARYFHEDRFRKALRRIPNDFMWIINLVVLNNEIFKGKQEERYLAKSDLVRGLDYLCDFYAKMKIRED